MCLCVGVEADIIIYMLNVLSNSKSVSYTTTIDLQNERDRQRSWSYINFRSKLL